MVAIQLDALQVGEQVLLNFVQVLDLTDLRSDDTDDEDTGGGTVERAFWDNKAGSVLMKMCDEILALVNAHAQGVQEFNYLRGYMGMRSNGVVRNLIYFSPKRTKNLANLGFRCNGAEDWKTKFEEAGIPVQSKHKNRFRIKLTPDDFVSHRDLIDSAIEAAVEEAGV